MFLYSKGKAVLGLLSMAHANFWLSFYIYIGFFLYIVKIRLSVEIILESVRSYEKAWRAEIIIAGACAVALFDHTVEPEEIENYSQL